MSLFKFGGLEAEIDFTDVDFLENLEEAKRLMQEEAEQVPKTGSASDIVRAQCWCYFKFFDRVIGNGAHDAMFQGKTSLNLCLDAIGALLAFDHAEAEKLDGRYSEYTVQKHANRQDRRNYEKQKSGSGKQGKGKNWSQKPYAGYNR